LDAGRNLSRSIEVKMPKAGKKNTSALITKRNSATKKIAKNKAARSRKPAPAEESERLLSSEVVYEGPLFRVLHDKLIEPGGLRSERDVIRHNGSVVIMAIDRSKNKKDPWIVMERQYRHAALRMMWELPAGKLDPGEDALAGAQRELAEETGYTARKWKPLIEYWASPGFPARPEEDERIDFRLVKLSELLKMIEKGGIVDGKTLTAVLFYLRLKKGARSR